MTPIPEPKGKAAANALQALLQKRNVLSSLEALHESLGNVFRIPLPGFNTVVLVGPEANHFMLVESKKDLRWRAEKDPVTELLRNGFLVQDGDVHDELRRQINPALHRNMLGDYVEKMWRRSDQISSQWQENARVDVLDEMRKIAILVLMDTLFDEDFSPHLKPLWHSILRTIQYISPGLWLIWPGATMRPRYSRALQQLDDYLYQLINHRRRSGKLDDLLGGLIAAGLSDDLIRDQLLTLFIAGHDTSTAVLAWTLYLLCVHPVVLERVRQEIDVVLGSRTPTYADSDQLQYLDQVIKETLRLYPPIHLGSRIANRDLEFQNYVIPANTRVLYSIYLMHRHKDYWPQSATFDPDRFTPENSQGRPAYTYLPYGGGARNCIGAAFAQVESKIILARLIQNFDFRLLNNRVRPRMNATLEPYPGVYVEVKRRSR